MRQKIDQFEEICKLINNFETEDAIIQTLQLKEILKIFSKYIVDEKTLSDLFDFLNTKALQDDGFITKFVSVVCLRQMDSFNINGKIARHSMLEILQKNFQSADHFKRDDVNKFYNSMKLLGEYFNKARIPNGSPINILGQSLLNLLNIELEKELKTVFHFKNDDFSELVLTQIALNGNLLKTRHKTEIESVLMNIRKCLIEINSLTSKTKAFLIMTLDLYYSNFSETNLEKSIEKVYEPYLLDNSDSRKNTNNNNKKVSEETPKVIKTKLNGNSHQQPSTSSTSQKSMTNISNDRRASAPKSPTKPLRPPLRKSEPVQSNHHNNHNHPSNQQKSPQKKISPKELRTRTNSNINKISPRNDLRNSYSSKSLYKVESAIDKLQIKSSNDIKQTSNTSETVPQSTNEENILKQQNSNGNSMKSKAAASSATSKVYFKEENVENLSWNGETSFEDPENPADTSPNQYSSSFLNFLSNNRI